MTHCTSTNVHFSDRCRCMCERFLILRMSVCVLHVATRRVVSSTHFPIIRHSHSCTLSSLLLFPYLSSVHHSCSPSSYIDVASRAVRYRSFSSSFLSSSIFRRYHFAHQLSFIRQRCCRRFRTRNIYRKTEEEELITAHTPMYIISHILGAIPCVKQADSSMTIDDLLLKYRVVYDIDTFIK